MNKSFPYNCRERGVRGRISKWLFNDDTTTQRQLRKDRILGNVKAFVVGCFVGIAIQLML